MRERNGLKMVSLWLEKTLSATLEAAVANKKNKKKTQRNEKQKNGEDREKVEKTKKCQDAVFSLNIYYSLFSADTEHEKTTKQRKNIFCLSDTIHRYRHPQVDLQIMGS